jgi:hypothetical protein
MTRYIAIHRIRQRPTQEEMIAGAKVVAAGLGDQAQWLNSWWLAGGEDKMFCEWEAEDEASIHAALEAVKDVIPIETIHEVTWINPGWFDD